MRARGRPISAIVFGGRRAKTAPLVYEALNWEHGVFVGSIMASETTAAASGAIGVVRGTRWPCCPSAATTWAITSATGWKWAKNSATRRRRFFNVNWFRLDESGHFYLARLRRKHAGADVILGRAKGTARAIESPIGHQPLPEDIELTGLDLPLDTLKSLLAVDPALWLEDLKDIAAFYKRSATSCPRACDRSLKR